MFERLRYGHRNIRCPHCQGEWRPGEIKYEDDTGALHDAERRGLFGWGPPRIQGYKQAVCPEPTCRGPLPRSALQGDNLMIGMVGAPNSGKTTYIAAVVDVLQKGLGDFCTTAPALDPATADRYERDFRPVIDSGIPVMQTGEDAQPPLLFDLGVKPKATRLRSAMLCLYDGAGDPQVDMARMLRDVPYIGYADGLIVVIDPLQIEAVRELVGEGVAGKSSQELLGTATANNVLQNVLHVMERHERISPDGNARIPLAITVSKCDVLDEANLLEDEDAWRNQELRHDGIFDVDLHQRLSGILSAKLKEWESGAFSLIESRFPDHAFFGISATGGSPVKQEDTGDVVYENVRPWRVEEPVLWLAWKFGLIQGTSRPLAR